MQKKSFPARFLTNFSAKATGKQAWPNFSVQFLNSAPEINFPALFLTIVAEKL